MISYVQYLAYLTSVAVFLTFWFYAIKRPNYDWPMCVMLSS